MIKTSWVQIPLDVWFFLDNRVSNLALESIHIWIVILLGNVLIGLLDVGHRSLWSIGVVGNFRLLYLSFGLELFLFPLNYCFHIPELVFEIRQFFGHFVDIGHVGLDPQIGNEPADAIFELLNVVFLCLERGLGEVATNLYDLADRLLTIVLLHMNPD